jgi:hypothetical protein
MQAGIPTHHEGHRAGPAWSDTLQDGLVAGSIVSVVTIAAIAWRGIADSGSAVAPINATSHVIYGPGAGSVGVRDLKHTLPGLAINAGASVFWAMVYEGIFGPTSGRGAVGKALLGGGVVAGLAYLIDYHLMPKRLTPGWEEAVSGRSLAMIFGAMALSLPLRSIFKRPG